MRGFIGCDNAELAPGDVIVTGHHLELRMTIIRAATEQEARDSADRMGQGPLVVVPGEVFYEVETTTSAVGSTN